MRDKDEDDIDYNNVENFTLFKLQENWPFSLELGRDLFIFNKNCNFKSFKEFLIFTWLKEINHYSMEDSDSDSEIVNEEDESWPD